MLSSVLQSLEVFKFQNSYGIFCLAVDFKVCTAVILWFGIAQAENLIMALTYLLYIQHQLLKTPLFVLPYIDPCFSS